MTPNILISGSDISRSNYENALTAAGASYGSFYLPKASEDVLSPAFLNSYDGLLLAGGGDVDPSLFGQENTDSGTPDLKRDQIELELIRLFMSAGKPILGICRGFQIVNVVLGGTLHQDVGEAGHRIHTPERNTPVPPTSFEATASDAVATAAPATDIVPKTTLPSDKVHLTRAAEFSFLGQLYGSVFSVNSAHHQSVDRLADPLLAIQWAMEDGCIEGAIHPGYPYIGVQWHPERMCLEKAREDTVNGLAVFLHFLSLF